MRTVSGRYLLPAVLSLSLLISACAAPRLKPEQCRGGVSSAQPTLREKVAQMLIIGFRAIELNGDEPIVRDICNYGIGGVILFDYDDILKTYERDIVSPEQVAQLTASLRSYSRIPLFISIDQEGGRVARLKERYGFPPTVTAQFLGSADKPELTAAYARSMAETLKKVGINVNFAPVVDLNVNPQNPIIGKLERSFSADPVIVASQAGIFVNEHKRAGILTSLKHFPGHGSSTADSHKGFVDVSETWSEKELEPYYALIGQGKADMVMTAHIYNKKLDPDYPATLSYATITGLLRNRLGFKGVVVSDDMQMGAIARHYSFETAVERAILAGVDILDVANESAYDPDAAPRTIDLVVSLVNKGVISEQRIDESYQRIMALKKLLPR